MHLITFLEGGQSRVGVLDPQRREVCDLSRAAPDLPRDMLAFIGEGDGALAEAARAVAGGAGRLAAEEVRLLAPVPEPVRNLICIGKNYRDHAEEVQSMIATGSGATEAIPKRPIIFSKATTSVIGPLETVPAWLDPTQSADYEGELGVVIGRGGRGIGRSNAMEHVYGYTIINDVTSRRMQRGHHQWFLGKSIDGFCPMGPSIVTADEIPEPGRLRLQTYVNGELRQDASVSSLIFDIPTLIETLAATMTLIPGDIIATGTPSGVGVGFKPPRFLEKGDVVRISIDPIGALENPVE